MKHHRTQRRPRLNRRFTPMKLLVILAIITIPSIYGGVFTSFSFDPSHRINHIPAALVNEDSPVTVNGKETNLGADLSEELLTSDSTSNFKWETTDADTARQGLEDGTYQAVLTIPENFSATATSIATEAPANAQAAQITITTNDGSNIISGNIAGSVGNSIAQSLSDQISEQYLYEVYTGLTNLNGQLGQASSAASDLSEGAGKAATGGQTALTGASELSSGAGTLAEGTETLASGSRQLADSAQTLSDNYALMTDEQRQQALAQLAGSADALAQGAAQADTGADQLSAGLTTLVGAEDSGLTQLSNGLNQLSTGSQELATALSGGSTDSPTYSHEEAEHLSKVVAAPVTAEAIRLNEVPTYGHGLAPYFMSLSLWVGAIAYFLMFPAIRSELGRRHVTGFRALVGSLIPLVLMGAAQGSVLALVLHFWVGLESANFAGLWGLSVLASIAFLAINQALIALLDAPGRFISLLLAVFQLAAAGGTYPIETTPTFFQAIHHWLPLTHALEGFRSFIAGGSLGVAQAFSFLLLWGGGAVAVTAFSIWLRHHREGRHQKGVGEDLTTQAATS